MRIGIVGVPGSGKTKLANGLVEKIGQDQNIWEQMKPIRVIDDYVPELANRMDMELGFRCDYLGNLAVALDRIGRERKAREVDNAGFPGASTITCGTHIDTIAYNTFWYLRMQGHYVQDGELTHEFRYKTETSIEFLSLIYEDIDKYDILYWLPGPESDDSDIVGLRDMIGSLIPKLQENGRLPEAIGLSLKEDEALDKAFETINDEFNVKA